MNEVLVVIGIGGIGQAIARRLGSGSALLLADVDEGLLARLGDVMRGEGHDVHTQRVDVSDPESVAALATAAAGLGSVRRLAHTAGLSPVQAPAEAVLRVDLFGVAYVLEAFEPVMAPGGAAVVIASMAGTNSAAGLTPEEEVELACAPARDLPTSAVVVAHGLAHGNEAYGFAKRANQLRVKGASIAWGRRNVRLNSISPGIISTPMAIAELEGPSGTMMRTLIEGSSLGREGTPDDIAAAADFLLGPMSAFVTGTDLLVDGGAVAAESTGQLDLASLMGGG